VAEGLTGRAADMAESVLRIAASRGVAEAGLDRMAGALTEALGHRQDRLTDDHDPALLHPARTALILLRDADEADPSLLAAGILLETRRPELATAPSTWARLLDDEGMAVLQGAPRPDAAELAEALVVRAPGTCGVSLAEHLDHLRHLHMETRGPELPDDARRRWDEVQRIWLPVAERTHAGLARRYRHWVRVFGRRLERGDRAEGSLGGAGSAPSPGEPSGPSAGS